MSFENVIQLAESVSYPDGFNAITIEGTGDEGGLATFAKVTLSVSPGTVEANGVNYFTCIATAYDPNNPSATVVGLQSERVTASMPYVIQLGKILKTFVGLWYDDGNGNKGADLSSYIDEVKRDHIVLKTPLQYSQVIVEYYGNDSITFDTSNPLLSLEHEDDPDWSLPTISGEFMPYDNPIADAEYGKPATVTVRFLPNFDQSGIGYITAHFNGGFATAKITCTGAAATFDISIEADPSSIPTYSESKVIVKVTQGGLPVTGRTVDFSIWHNASYGYLTKATVALETQPSTEEVTSSKDLEKNASYLNVANPIVSIISVKDINGIDYTASARVDRAERTKINLNPPFPFEEILCVVEYVFGGVAKTTFRSIDKVTINPDTEIDDPVIVRGVCSGRDKVCAISITEGVINSGMSIEALPSSLPERTGSLPPHGDTIPPTNGESYIRVTAVKEDGSPDIGANVTLGITKGQGTLSRHSISLGIDSLTETVLPSDATHINVSKAIASNPTVTRNGQHLTVASYSGSTITLASALPDLEACIVDYEYGGVGGCYYTPPLNWSGEVAVMATSGSYAPARCTIEVGDGVTVEDWVIAVTPEMSRMARDYSQTITAKVFTSEPGPPAAPGQPDNPPTITPIVGAPVRFWLSNPTDQTLGILTPNAPFVTNSDGIATATYGSLRKLGTEVIVATTTNDKSGYCNVEVIGTAQTRHRYKFLLFDAVVEPVTAKMVSDAEATDGWSSRGYNLSIGAGFVGGASVAISRRGLLEYMDSRLTVDRDPTLNPTLLSVIGAFTPPVSYHAIKYELVVTGGAHSEWCNEDGSSFRSDEEKLAASQPRIGGSFLLMAKVVLNNARNNKDFLFPVTVAGAYNKGLPGVTVTIAGQSVTTNAAGIAEFRDLPAGTHRVVMSKDNYLANVSPDTYDATAEWDLDASNDTVTVPDFGQGTVKLQHTSLQLQCYCIIESYDAYYGTYEGNPSYRFMGEV